MPSRTHPMHTNQPAHQTLEDDSSELVTDVIDIDPEGGVEESLVEYEAGEEMEEAEEAQGDPEPPVTGPPPLPPYLKDISSLASWTVSTAKPGCSVPQLRAPSTALFWQSDGPQPHLLNIHFFKMVEIAGIRIHLDFELDESYTPTKIAFMAGTGYADLQEWCVMNFEQPRGWVDVDFSGVGAMEGESDSEDDAREGEDDEELNGERKRWPLLRCMLVQVQIRENHQNGKDTHLRGLQIFARDRSGTRASNLSKPESNTIAGKAERSKKKRITLPEPQWDAAPSLR